MGLIAVPNIPLLIYSVSGPVTNRCLIRGEQTAQVLESNLTNLEKKIDDLLASFEESERRMVDANGKRTVIESKKEDNGNEKA